MPCRAGRPRVARRGGPEGFRAAAASAAAAGPPYSSNNAAWASAGAAQRGILGAELSQQILNVGKCFAVVLGQPAIVITLEEHKPTLKTVKTGPADALTNVKHEEEIEDDETQALDEAEVVAPANVDKAHTHDQACRGRPPGCPSGQGACVPPLRSPAA